MDVLLESNEVSFAQAARFTLVSADLLDEVSTAAEAYALALEKDWLPANARADKPVKLGELCFLIMNAFGRKGSFLYALFPGPRYAFRELDWKAGVHTPRLASVKKTTTEKVVNRSSDRGMDPRQYNRTKGPQFPIQRRYLGACPEVFH
ncbi:MAG: hypothetical protein LBQ14_10680 [Treponema sp.]|jgi:sulfur carrier protein ThiS|nr:hypothetical protein [Treponema sp.]